METKLNIIIKQGSLFPSALKAMSYFILIYAIVSLSVYTDYFHNLISILSLMLFIFIQVVKLEVEFVDGNKYIQHYKIMGKYIYRKQVVFTKYKYLLFKTLSGSIHYGNDVIAMVSPILSTSVKVKYKVIQGVLFNNEKENIVEDITLDQSRKIFQIIRSINIPVYSGAPHAHLRMN